MHVTHNKEIVYISPAFPGSRNDLCSVRQDEFVHRIRTEDLFTKYEFQLLNEEGEWVTHHGAWVLCDGGYHAWRQTMAAMKNSAYEDERGWANRLVKFICKLSVDPAGGRGAQGHYVILPCVN